MLFPCHLLLFQDGVNSSAYNYLKDGITQYTKSISKSGTYLLQALPRLITLWLTFTALSDKDKEKDKHGLRRTASSSSKSSSSSSSSSSPLSI